MVLFLGYTSTMKARLRARAFANLWMPHSCSWQLDIGALDFAEPLCRPALIQESGRAVIKLLRVVRVLKEAEVFLCRTEKPRVTD